MKVTKLLFVFIVLFIQGTAHAGLWSADSNEFGKSNIDLSLKEVERRPKSSVVQIDIKKIGSSVGSSMLIACMIHQLADERGGYRYIVKLDERPNNRGQMLIGFMRNGDEKPKSLDPEFPEVMNVMDFDIFGEGFRKGCRANRKFYVPFL